MISPSSFIIKLFVETNINLFETKMFQARKLFDITTGTFSYYVFRFVQKRKTEFIGETYFHFVFIPRHI